MFFRDFVGKLLGPALKSNNITKNLKLMLNDDNRYALPWQADLVINYIAF